MASAFYCLPHGETLSSVAMSAVSFETQQSHVRRGPQQPPSAAQKGNQRLLHDKLRQTLPCGIAYDARLVPRQ